MKHYGFPPAAYIGWIRIARPGSILGPQQNYLLNMDQRMMQIGGEAKRNELLSKVNSSKISSGLDAMTLSGQQYGFSEEDKQIAEHGDIGQGERLVNAQRNRKK